MKEIGHSNWMLIFFLCVLNVNLSVGMNHSRCEEITIPLCQNLSYSETVFPNPIGLDTQEAAEHLIQQYYPLVKVQCSPFLKPFLCALFTPECSSEREEIIPPCRSLCHLARAGCEPVMPSFGDSWPRYLDCSRFPSSDNQTCVDEHYISNPELSPVIEESQSVPGKPSRVKNSEGKAMLRYQILDDENKFVIPDDVTVKFEMGIHSLHVNQQMGILDIGTRITLSWVDSRRTWDNETNPVHFLHVQNQDIWKPDILNLNSVKMNKDMIDCWEGDAILYPNGNTIWERPCQIQTYCNLTLRNYPYNEQNCEMKFGSWNYAYDLLNLEGTAIDLSNYGSEEPYILLTHRLTFQRIQPNA